MTVALATHIVELSRTVIFDKIKDILASLDVDVETWAEGDPTREYLYAASIQFETYEKIIASAIKGGFYDTAEDDWLDLKAESDDDVAREVETAAETTIVLTSASAAPFEIETGDLTVGVSGSDITYRNTIAHAPITLLPGGTATLTVVAETAGSASSVEIGDIDTILGPAMANVSVTNTTAGVGRDREKDGPFARRARESKAILSPNGPKDAIRYVAVTRKYNGGVDCTDARVIRHDTKGEVTAYLRGSQGAVTDDTRDTVKIAIERYASPLIGKRFVYSAVNYVQDVTYELWLYDSSGLTEDEARDKADAAILAALASRPIGGDIIPPATTGKLYRGFIQSEILKAVSPFGFACTVTTPAADIDLAIDRVIVPGILTGTVHLVEGP